MILEKPFTTPYSSKMRYDRRPYLRRSNYLQDSPLMSFAKVKECVSYHAACQSVQSVHIYANKNRSIVIFRLERNGSSPGRSNGPTGRWWHHVQFEPDPLSYQTCAVFHIPVMLWLADGSRRSDQMEHVWFAGPLPKIKTEPLRTQSLIFGPCILGSVRLFFPKSVKVFRDKISQDGRKDH